MDFARFTGRIFDMAKKKIWKRGSVWAILVSIVFLSSLLGLLTIGKAKFAFVDFYDCYYAAELCAKGKDPYNGTFADELAKRDKVDYIPGSDYIYPLPLAVTLVPATQLQSLVAAILWYILTAALFLIALVRLTRIVDPEGPEWKKGLLILFGVFFAPTFYSFWVGQANAIVFFLVVFGLDAMIRTHQSRRAGIFIGLAAVIKIIPIFLLVIPFLKKRYTALKWAGIWIAGAFLVSEIAAPGSTGKFFGKISLQLWEYSRHHAHPVNQGIRGYLLRMFELNDWTTPLDNLPGAVGIGIIITFVVLGGIVVDVFFKTIENRETRNESTTTRYLQAGLILSCLCIMSPLAWEHSFMILLIPFMALWRAGYKWFAVVAWGMMWIQRGLDGFANNPQDWPTLSKHPELTGLGLMAGIVTIIGCAWALYKRKQIQHY